MASFQKGDKVRRVRGGHAGMKVGDTGVVLEGGVYKLLLDKYTDGCGATHDPSNFELIEPFNDMILSTDATARKNTPITTGVLDYFPRALAAVAQCSKAGNDQHNPGKPLHWAKEKSKDHADCIARHLIDRNSNDTDGVPHAAKLAWRALALLEIMLEEQENNNAA